MAFVVSRRNQFLVRQRPANVVNSHLWEFPNIEIMKDDGDPLQNARRVFGSEPPSLAPLCEIKHTITRYRISLETYRIQMTYRDFLAGDGNWMSLPQLRRLAFASAHKKILNRLQEGR